jgi:hypothetical protein
MKSIFLIFPILIVFFCCEPKKDPAPAPVLGKSFTKISTPNTTIYVGDTLKVEGSFTNEKAEKSVPDFNWTSTKPQVATVSQTGLVKAIKVGQAFIISEYSSKSDTILITVLSASNKPGAVNETTTGTNTTSGNNTTTTGTLTVSGSNTVTGTIIPPNTAVSDIIIIASMSSIMVNSTQQLEAQVYNSDSKLLEGKLVSWISSDNSILLVNSSGLITGLKAGMASVTASIEGVNSLPYKFVVGGSSMRTGTFVGTDAGHLCTGSTVMKYNSGSNLTVELSSDFSVTAGPDLYVYLASDISSGSAVNSKGLLVAVLGATTGARTYIVPAGTDINTYKYVVIQCKQYAHTFGYAQLQ